MITGGSNFAPLKHAKSSESNLCIAVTPHGAHVAHMTGKIVPKPFYKKVLIEWFMFLEARNTFKKK